ncbi:hypothetical protein GQ600_23800 [Phytophthora cactorum]|nr:hypothetical protein GQ600_23800 [Phytophthora cactorum]
MEGYPRWISGFPDSRTLTTSDGLGGHEIPRIVHERISLARELGASASHSWFFSLDANVTFRYRGSTHMFAFIVDDYLAIDLACGFGWCGSPAMYFLPGALTNGQNEDSSNSSAVGLSSPFVDSFWCDDHTCIEVDTGPRCCVANLALAERCQLSSDL